MILNKKVYIWPDFIALIIPSEVPSTERQQCENQLNAEYPSHYLPVNTRVWNIKILDMNINFNSCLCDQARIEMACFFGGLWLMFLFTES